MDLSLTTELWRSLDGDDSLGVFHGATEDLSTRSMVGSRATTHYREGSGFTVGDGADVMSAHRYVLLLERGQDFASEDLQKQCVDITSTVDLTKT